MGLHAYCITPRGHRPGADLRGLDDAAIEAIDMGGIAVWASVHAAPRPASIGALRVHDAVVHAALDRTVTPVPIRFGQWFETEAALVERIGADRAHWEERLTQLGGCAEFAVAIIAPEPEQEAARDVRKAAVSAGTAHMRKLAQEHARAAARRAHGERVAKQIGERLGGIAIDTRLDLPPEGPVAARLAHLVAWRDTEAYHGAMSELRACDPDVRLHLSGPLAPWSFA